ncbi:large ribosomal subunit protein eL27-like [Bidens hawaiensis]|uniref:large ribosomal subunit protein eL27-like n=1 Tax=Bidens hawaiensis TaxID=980011 RepID=UPI00404AC7DD
MIAQSMIVEEFGEQETLIEQDNIAKTLDQEGYVEQEVIEVLIKLKKAEEMDNTLALLNLKVVVELVKFLKPNKAVVVLNGRFAGRKAVIVKQFDDGTRDRPYGHCLVAGISKYPKKVIRKDSAKKTAKKSRVKAFIKLVNYNHIMPTRYTLDVDLKDVVSVDALQSRDKKVSACKETKKRFGDRFKSGKNRWFFSKLRF